MKPKKYKNRHGYNTTNDWITPHSYIKAFGEFDLDPCASLYQKIPYAKTNYTVNEDGLSRDWEGKVWMNPPYGREIKDWVVKFFHHGHGVALLPSRTGNSWFHEYVFRSGFVLFLKGRIKFHGWKDYKTMTGMHDSVFWVLGDDFKRKLCNLCLKDPLFDGTIFVKGKVIQPYKNPIIFKGKRF